MGNRLTNSISDDNKWASVSKFSQTGENWDTIDSYLFKNFTDDDMINITRIFGAKKSAISKSNYNTNWLVNHAIIRVINIKWDPIKKGYDCTCSIKQGDDTNEIKKYHYIIKKYPSNKMARLAVNIEALNDYKAMKCNKSKGEIFNKIASELNPYHQCFK